MQTAHEQVKSTWKSFIIHVINMDETLFATKSFTDQRKKVLKFNQGC